MTPQACTRRRLFEGNQGVMPIVESSGGVIYLMMDAVVAKLQTTGKQPPPHHIVIDNIAVMAKNGRWQTETVCSRKEGVGFVGEDW